MARAAVPAELEDPHTESRCVKAISLLQQFAQQKQPRIAPAGCSVDETGQSFETDSRLVSGCARPGVIAGRTASLMMWVATLELPLPPTITAETTSDMTGRFVPRLRAASIVCWQVVSVASSSAETSGRNSP
jgi:hypothetical protein